MLDRTAEKTVFNRDVYMSDPKISLITIKNKIQRRKKNKITLDMLKYINEV